MLATLQLIVRNVLILSTIIGLVFMMACTVFVVVCIIHGDIKINITRDGTEKENEQVNALLECRSIQWVGETPIHYKNELEKIL